MDENELQALYQWVDEIPLSRPKRNIARDFSDGVLMAEIVKHFFPKLVDLHNYSPAQSVAQKQYNWGTLDQKVLRKLNFSISKKDLDEVASCVPGAVERILSSFRARVLQIQQRRLTGQSPGDYSPEPIPLEANYAQQQYPPRRGGDPYQDLMLGQALGQQGQQGHYGVPPPHYGATGGAGGNGGNNGFTLSRQPQQPPQGGQGDPRQYQQMQQQRDMASEIIAEKDETINEMKETIEILEVKIRKLEQLVKIKDHKIQTLQAKLQAPGSAR